MVFHVFLLWWSSGSLPNLTKKIMLTQPPVRHVVTVGPTLNPLEIHGSWSRRLLNMKSMSQWSQDTLWWTYKKQWKITIFDGKIHYFDWAIFHSFFLVHERVAIRQSNSGILNQNNQNWIFWKFPPEKFSPQNMAPLPIRVQTGQVGYEKMQSQMAYVSKWFGLCFQIRWSCEAMVEALVLSRCSKPI